MKLTNSHNSPIHESVGAHHVILEIARAVGLRPQAHFAGDRRFAAPGCSPGIRSGLGGPPPRPGPGWLPSVYSSASSPSSHAFKSNNVVFAGSVGAGNQAEHFARRDGEGHLTERRKVSVALCQTGNVQTQTQNLVTGLAYYQSP